VLNHAIGDDNYSYDDSQTDRLDYNPIGAFYDSQSAQYDKLFNSILLVPSTGHTEINLMRALFQICRPDFMELLAEQLGFCSKRAVEYIVTCRNHHLSWQIVVIVLYSFALELIQIYEENRIEQFIILNGISWVLLFKMCFNSITTHLFVANCTNQAPIDTFICYCIRYTITINSHPLSAVANVTLSQDFLHTFNDDIVSEFQSYKRNVQKQLLEQVLSTSFFEEESMEIKDDMSYYMSGENRGKCVCVKCSEIYPNSVSKCPKCGYSPSTITNKTILYEGVPSKHRVHTNDFP
jgi:hypothetical protein